MQYMRRFRLFDLCFSIKGTQKESGTCMREYGWGGKVKSQKKRERQSCFFLLLIIRALQVKNIQFAHVLQTTPQEREREEREEKVDRSNGFRCSTQYTLFKKNPSSLVSKRDHKIKYSH